ncbi:hypothetical protein GCM10011529_04620 [Polymorphobacter glacialis]|uniref:Thioredoxin-like fold domain-containing protein n=1 Tax=Sandarakinorhabdus glacialis TaxID=1614636 RepID=A0A916ZJR9_9SPHN|nr:thioredoxin domain-containing protein [Polymorphobacter glacialis]GGE01360.1 hypothetical protein GCM10011529_04620 [Polymorphobacter glacialis]
MRLTSGPVFGLAMLATLAACGDKTAKAPETPAADTTAAATAIAPMGGTAAPASTNWTETVVATPEGGFRMGNPNAKVKLLEFASLTCPHCKDFHAEALETIKTKYVASGDVSYEFRNFVLNGPDFAASLLARCQGPAPFFGLLASFFRDQDQWTKGFIAMSKADQDRITALPQDQQLAAMATTAKLDEYVRARGIPRAKFEACVADKASTETLTKMGTQATETYKLTGTPGFIINGTTQKDVYTWAALEPKLQEALR